MSGRILLLAALLSGAPAGAWADDPVKVDVTIRDHRFVPAELHVPAGRPAMLMIANQDTTAEEFESNALKVEKVIPAGQTLGVRLRPLGPGHYPFFGDYHQDTAQGIVVAE